MFFYNYVNHGNRYKYSGKILYNYLKKENEDLIYKDISSINNLDIKDEDYVYYYFEYNNKPLSSHIIGRDPKANKYFDKISQYNDFKEFFPESIIIDSYNNLKVCIDMIKRNNKLYVTLDKGYGGNSSFIIDKHNIYDTYNIIKNNNTKARVTPYLNIVKNISVHLILFKDGYIITNKTNQYIYKNVQFRGNFYPNNLTEEENKYIDMIIVSIADKLIKMNILGIIGLDLMITDDNKVYLAEINPHKMGSSACINMLSELEWNIPIPILEYYACSGLSINDIKLKVNDINKIKWSLLYLYNTENISNKYNIINSEDMFDYMKDTYNNRNNHTVYFKDNYNSKDMYFRFKIEAI